MIEDGNENRQVYMEDSTLFSRRMEQNACDFTGGPTIQFHREKGKKEGF
jgi:extradiol dioxygenase family protein